MLGQVISS